VKLLNPGFADVISGIVAVTGVKMKYGTVIGNNAWGMPMMLR